MTFPSSLHDSLANLKGEQLVSIMDVHYWNVHVIEGNSRERVLLLKWVEFQQAL